ncbi:TlpA family protein disulfide reductase [Lacihabitans sp. LS3-19]|uniref:TlpA family protein disulfide reductase n=1 Tax=Lacihabitans sp. LS3-19 TaxID=2487335 RepID=UPI0020CF0FD4|nr:TlpA disulfide reductase family protein [Lacihabitans sp. LS3-19]MCP9769981.1 TlpA family protein disulfide reductase [Lacihabitans sp. LS3-19]
MMRKFTVFLLLNLLSVSGKSLYAQDFFKFSGNIKNFDEDAISFTLYKNWVEEPTDLQLKLDKKGNFVVEFPLEEIAYCDINIGDEGFYLWKIEPKDNIILNADFNAFQETFKISGEGSEKWLYLLAQKKAFETDKDWDFELENLKKVSKKGYFDLTNYLITEQINLLNKYKQNLSEDFYSLQRADIYGKYSALELSFLNFHHIFNEEEFKRFSLKTFNGKTQSKSYDFGHFVEALIENHNVIGKKYDQSIMLEYESIMAYFSPLDLVDKQLIERILANKISLYLDNFGATEETKLLVGSFKNFSKNKIYINVLLDKLSKLQNLREGKEAKQFILPDEKGNLVALKDFKGKNLVLGFYATWCGPCIEDMQSMRIVDNYFKNENDLIFVFINLDNPSEFARFLKEEPHFGTHLSGFGNKDLKSNYLTEILPNYFLIDKTGTIISERLDEPSTDEGRSLINHIESLLYKK